MGSRGYGRKHEKGEPLDTGAATEVQSLSVRDRTCDCLRRKVGLLLAADLRLWDA